MPAPVRRVLLLNPPGDRLYIRDQFCSHVSKGTYYWQPLDLVMLSGTLHAAGFELAVVDAIAERLAAEEALRRIDRFAPDAVVFLTGSDSFDDDAAFIAEVKRRGARLAIGCGDILRDKGERLLALHPAIDAALLDFVSHGLVAYLEERAEPDACENLIVRAGTAIVRVPARAETRSFTLPTPRYDIFPLDRYRMPYNRHHPYAAVIASSWCPYGCSFCPFARTPYRVREVGDVMKDLAAIHAMGIRQVHFADWTFGVDAEAARELVDRIAAARFGFTLSCLSRVDRVDFELLRRFRAAGLDLIELGVESGDQTMLDRYDKGITLDQVRRAFASTRELGISTLATFIFGLPGETRASMQATLDLALEIEPTFCSFNVASPRMGTELRHEMVGSGAIADPDGTVVLDSSRTLPAFSTPELSATEVKRFHERAIRRFYLRPSYLARRLRRLGSWVEVKNHIGNGSSLVWQTIRPARAPRA